MLNKLIAEQFWLLLCLGQDLINHLGNISVLLEQDNYLRQEVQPVIVYKHVTLSYDSIAEGYYAEFLENGMCLFLVMVWQQFFKCGVSQVRVCLDLEFQVLLIVPLAERINSFLGNDFLKFMSYIDHKAVDLRYVLNENFGVFEALAI